MTRLFLCTIGLIAVAGIARANDTRTVPAAGASLTYRLLSTTKVGETAVTTGEIYTYIVTSSDGAIAEGTIKPAAMILDCPASDIRPACVNARKSANARQEHDQVVMPIPEDLANRLAQHSSFKFRHFLPEKRQVVMPAPKAIDDGDNTAFSSEPGFTVINEIECVPDDVRKFLPIGSVQAIVLPCELSVSNTAWLTGHLPASSSHEAVKIELSYQGKDRVAAASGEWAIQKLAYHMVSSDGGHTILSSEIAFSERLGASIISRSRYSAANGQITEFFGELIAATP